MTVNNTTWTALGGIGAVLIPLGIASRYAWKYVRRFFALFDHERRLKALEDDVATRSDLTSLGAELHRLHDEHKAEDAEAFRNLNADVSAVKEHMATSVDLRRVEGKLDQLLLDGFSRGRRT